MTKDRILVAFDGSAAGVAALEKAVAITDVADASIDLLYVIDTRSYQVGFSQQPDVDGTPKRGRKSSWKSRPSRCERGASKCARTCALAIRAPWSRLMRPKIMPAVSSSSAAPVSG